MDSRQDAHFMARAISLARSGLYTTDPNPRVGCVIVKDGRIIAEGWHQQAGQAHAEVMALSKAGDVAGATAYVTLEPCSHHGKTPPCSEQLIEAGIGRVVTAMQDPNPLVAGTGINHMRAAGIQVDSGILEQDARALNAGFISRMTTGRPYIISKLACSLDGCTAMASGESKWITSPQSRQDVHRLRAASSALLTGIGTVLADDPSLNARLEGFELQQPSRIVLDSNLVMPVTAKMLQLPGRTLIVTVSDDSTKQRALEQAGAEVYRVGAGNDGRIDLNAAFDCFGQLQFNQIMVEAGAVLNGALLQQGLVDEWLIYMAPCIMGDQGRGLFTIPGLARMQDKKLIKLLENRRIGDDLRLKFVKAGEK